MMSGKPSAYGYDASDRAQSDQYAQRCSAAFDSRRNVARLVRHVHERNLSDEVTETLRHRYHPNTFRDLSLDHGVQTWNNALVDILDKIATCWAGGATWRLVDGDGVDIESDAFKQFLDVADLDNLARHLDVLTELHPRVLVGPCITESSRRGMREFSWAIHTPESFDFVRDEDDAPDDFDGVAIYGRRQHGVTIRECKTVWLADTVTTFVLGNSGRWELVEQIDNPYRTVPFVPFGRDKPITSPWCSVPGRMLAEVTVEINAWETVLGNMGSGQIKSLAASVKNFPAGQVFRHGGVIDLGEANGVSMLDFQTDVTRFYTTYIQRPREVAAVACGLDPTVFAPSAQATSGTALALLYSQRDKRALAKRPFLKSSLDELFWMAQHVLAYQINMPDDDGVVLPIAGISDLIPYDPTTTDTFGARLSIDPAEPKYVELATERAAREDRDLALGLTSRAELYMERDPDASPEEARRSIEANLLLEAYYAKLGSVPAAALATTLVRKGAFGQIGARSAMTAMDVAPATAAPASKSNG